MAGLRECTKRAQTKNVHFPTSKEVRSLKQLMEGLVVGPLDKNNGEMWMTCPELYDRALSKAYGSEAGYKGICVPKVGRKIRDADALNEQIMETERMGNETQGNEKDLVKLWKRIYKERGWKKYAPFRTQGGFNRPYILFKAKNVTDLTTRVQKWKKARPISPGTKHPMRRLLHLAGRAWSFITANLEGPNFIINHGEQVPEILRNIQATIGKQGKIRTKVWDIESCYPNMPREIIRFSLRDLIKQIKNKNAYMGVRVPRFATTKTCKWINTPKERVTRQGSHEVHQENTERVKTVDMPFEVLLDVMEFALNNAIVKMPDGTLLGQTKGIPMGDPLSPAMTIGACAWMEEEWMQQIDEHTKKKFVAKRYMDDTVSL